MKASDGLHALVLGVVMAWGSAALAEAAGEDETGNEEMPAVCAVLRESSRIAELDAQRLTACVEAAEPTSVAHNGALMILALQALYDEKGEEALAFMDRLDNPEVRFENNLQYYLMRITGYELVNDEAATLTVADQLLERLQSGAMLHPKEAVGRAFRALVRIYSDQPEKLEATLDRYAQWRPDDGDEAASQLATLDSHNRSAEAVFIGRSTLNNFADHANYLNNYCYGLARVGLGDVALPYCLKAGRLEPDEAYIEHSISVAYAAIGDCAKARAFYDRSVSLLRSEIVEFYGDRLKDAPFVTEDGWQPTPPYSCPLDIATLDVEDFASVRVEADGRITGIPSQAEASASSP